MALWVFLKNDFVPAHEAHLPFNDLAIQRGYGVFEFFRLKGLAPLFLNDHLERFFHSASHMHLNPGYTPDALRAIVLELIEKNDLPDSGVRITLTGGVSADGMSIGKPNLVISQQSFTPPPMVQWQNGLKLITYEHSRQLPHIKTIDYLLPTWLQPVLKEKGVDDVVYTHQGQLTECPRSNFFLVMPDNTIATAAEGILHGITRKKVLELARRDFEVEERTISLADLEKAKEAFVTSTTKRILPVCQINDRLFSSSHISRHLRVLFDESY